MKTTTKLIICCLFLPLWVPAQQVEDYVLIDGKTQTVRADPLYRYLSSACPEKMLDDYVANFCDPYWPNYSRYWEVRDNWLYLLKIETNDKKVEYTLDLLFPYYDSSPIQAVWFSGVLSYRSGDSPVIQLNREYYEEEDVIQFEKGRLIDRFKINHRDRWILYARRIMDKYRPLEGLSLDIHSEIPMAATNHVPDSVGGQASTNHVSDAEWGMVDYLQYAFSVVTHPKEKPTIYFPVIWIQFNADLDGLELTEAHQELSSYELLETIARETDSVLDVAVSNQLVTFEIREIKAGETEASIPDAAAQAKDALPSEG